MATVFNARDVLLQSEARTVTITLPDGSTIDFDDVTGGTKPSNNADVTQTALIAGVTLTNGGITLNAGGALKGGKTTYGSGTGVFLGYHSSAYKLDIGSSTNYIRWDGSNLLLRGDIIGTSSIDITGTATFEGQTSVGGQDAAIVANSSGGSVWGIYAKGALGVYGICTSTAAGAAGIYGETAVAGGAGVYGLATNNSGTGVKAEHTGTGTALAVVGKSFLNGGVTIFSTNTLTWNSQVYAAPDGSSYKFMNANGAFASIGSIASGSSTGTFAGGSKPGNSTNSVWLAVVIGGTTYDLAAWPRA